MKTFSRTLTANQRVMIPGGAFLMLLENQYGVNVEFYSAEGTDLNETALDVDAGYRADFRSKNSIFGYAIIENVSASPNTIKIGVSKGIGGYDRAFGSVDLAGGYSQPVGGTENTANPPLVQFPSAQLVSPVPPTLATPFYYNGASGSLQTLVAPAANTAGIVVYGVGFYSTTGGAGRFMWKASAPASIHDAAAGTLLFGMSSSTAPFGNVASVPALPVKIPAGQGLYYLQSASICSAWIEYEVLP